MKPSDDPKADQLVNSNIAQPNSDEVPVTETPVDEESTDNMSIP